MKDSLIKALAATVMSMLTLLFLIEPFLIGKPRPKKSENYNVLDWVATWLSISIFVPICGRVLGWW